MSTSQPEHASSCCSHGDCLKLFKASQPYLKPLVDVTLIFYQRHTLPTSFRLLFWASPTLLSDLNIAVAGLFLKIHQTQSLWRLRGLGWWGKSGRTERKKQGRSAETWFSENYMRNLSRLSAQFMMQRDCQHIDTTVYTELSNAVATSSLGFLPFQCSSVQCALIFVPLWLVASVVRMEVLGQKPMDTLPICYRANKHGYLNMHVLGLWDETRIPKVLSNPNLLAVRDIYIITLWTLWTKVTTTKGTSFLLLLLLHSHPEKISFNVV